MVFETGELEIDIQDIINRSDLSSNTKTKLLKSKIIFLPASFSVRPHRGDFPSDTPNLVRYLRTTHPELEFSLFENAGQEKIQAQHAADIILPPIFFLVQDYSVQIAISIFSAYLYDRFKGVPDLGKRKVKLEILEGSLGSIKIKITRYEGPVEGMEKLKK
jgi:hypothetical protein